MHKYTNKLVNETSPYLLQHAHNPVDWHPWSEEVLGKAKAENKPVLVSIGYSACHWCHVMEKESFEDEQTARFMNEHFINIKIDREERPDLDHIYMDAVQAMTGSGGWPLNVFLTPQGKPFYGGTYYPPKKAFNRPSWMDVLGGVLDAFRERRQEIDSQAENLTEHLKQSNSFGQQAPGNEAIQFNKAKLGQVFENLLKQADKEWGGFGRAPKFPQTHSIQFLLRYHFTNGIQHAQSGDGPRTNTAGAEQALEIALLTLDKMSGGGIYDQVGGGFARYATDTEWLVPHFEKMLYDNALLLSVLSEAYQLTHTERYREVITETMEFIQRELMHPEWAFFAALDADSEGEEGKFYVWTRSEIDKLLGAESELFCEYYGVSAKGNWEGKNILWAREPLEKFSSRKNLQPEQLATQLKEGRQILLKSRNQRVRPGLDDKIILGWNALMNTATCKAYGATGEEAYKQLAIKNMQFLLDRFEKPGGFEMQHTWKAGQAKYPAFLDDYAFLIQALIHLQEITGDKTWLHKADQFVQFLIEEFSEQDTGFFFYTGKGQSDVILRKKEVYDGALPSGNSIMAQNLYTLSILLDRPEWKDRSMKMVASLENPILKFPTSFGAWACLLQEITCGTNEIAILGKDPAVIHKGVLGIYIPHRVLMVSREPGSEPLLSGKPLGEKTSIWLCHNYSCRRPVETIDQLTALINSAEAPN